MANFPINLWVGTKWISERYPVPLSFYLILPPPLTIILIGQGSYPWEWEGDWEDDYHRWVGGVSAAETDETPTQHWEGWLKWDKRECKVIAISDVMMISSLILNELVCWIPCYRTCTSFKAHWGKNVQHSSCIPYSRKIWWGIKFGGLAVYIKIKLKSAKISYSHIYVWRSRTKPPSLNLPIFLQ